MTMNNILSKGLIFGAGAITGSLITWFMVKRKYEEIAKCEIDSIRDYYIINNGSEVEDEDDDDDDDEGFDELELFGEYVNIVEGAEYIETKKKKLAAQPVTKEEPEPEEKEVEDDVIEPYVIVPEEFDEIGYETESLYWYEDDGTVEVCVSGEILDDETIEDWVGKESLTHFGEYEDDSVFVRNDNLRIDFEILRCEGSYTEGE